MDDLVGELLQAIKRRRIEGSIGDLDYQIGRKNVKGQMQINDATIKALLGYDGNVHLNAQAPLWGGNLNIDAQHNDNGNRFDLGYQRPIQGGSINFDAGRSEDGNRRLYFRLKKDF